MSGPHPTTLARTAEANQETLRAICCDCLVTVREGPGPVTHAICSDCEERYEREIAAEVRV